MQYPIADGTVLLTLKELIEQQYASVRMTDYVVFRSFPLETDTLYRMDFYTLILVTGGCIRYIVNDERFEVGARDVLFSPLSKSFAVSEVSADFSARCICFSNEFVSETGFNYRSTEILKGISIGAITVIRDELELFRKLKFYIDELDGLNRAESDRFYFKEMILHYFSLVIYTLNDHSRRTGEGKGSSFRNDEIQTVVLKA